MERLKFWTRDAWLADPVRSAITVAILMGILLLAAKFLAAVTAPSEMAILEVESIIYSSAVDAAGGDVAKAETVAAKEWPLECDNESIQKKTRRAAMGVRCIRRVSASTEVDVRLTAYVKSTGIDLATLDAVSGGDETGVCDPVAPFEPFGPESQACAMRINATASFPVSTRATILALLNLGLTRDNFRSAALEYMDVTPSPGWRTFAGGTELERWGPTRKELRAYVELPPAEGAGVLSLQDLQLVTRNVLTNDRAQHAAADATGDAALARSSGAFTSTLESGVTTLLFLAALMILWRFRRRTVGWRRVVATLGLILLGIGFLSPSSLSSLGLEHAQSAGGKSEGLAQILGAPFAVIAQILDLIRGAIVSLGEAATHQRIFFATMFLLVMFSQRRSVVALAAYGIVLAPYWFGSGTFSLLPMDLKGYEVALTVPTIVWITGIASTILAVVLVRGIWVAIGERFVESATNIVTPDTPDVP